MKQPIPRKSQLANRTWARDLEQRARNSVIFVEAVEPYTVCLKLQKEQTNPVGT